ncbi:hypothetical protein B9Q03_14830 [Candidatus Marsarchaeota G2 archaeon OSP_D]|uniref:Uncharacterized protein n=1 Tax=Candidatus Marsarchaeota G2 archaeon OSP_D TaxID=1978157 RepID=A0A2R6A6C0_9ARCH|nr:MAG: hypothetical protein B9Q03_14830 [Candidatus Marsarchaeota G2 archaeon OSP_D]
MVVAWKKGLSRYTGKAWCGEGYSSPAALLRGAGRREEKRDGKLTPQGFLPTAAHGTRYPFNTFAVCQPEENARMGEMG